MNKTPTRWVTVRSFLLGCRFGTIIALAITGIMFCLAHLVKSHGELAWDVGIIWYGIVLGPAAHLCRALGWNWNHPSHIDVQDTFVGFFVALVVNVLFHAAIAGVIGSIFGWFGRLLERYSVRE